MPARPPRAMSQPQAPQLIIPVMPNFQHASIPHNRVDSISLRGTHTRHSEQQTRRAVRGRHF
jgi:hypothetical protein